MSELMNAQRGRTGIRRQLLATVSIAALLILGSSAAQTRAEDADRPTVWIELGGQFEQVNPVGEGYSPPFASEIVQDGLPSLAEPQRAFGQSFGGESRISFQPENSDWVFSASIRYGRTSANNVTHHQTPGCPCKIIVGTQTIYGTPNPGHERFSDIHAGNNESHAVLDFQAGKDIGLGLFSRAGESTVNFGIRVAQFSSKQTATIKADPDFVFPTNLKYPVHWHTYGVSSHTERSFRGFGPSLSWNASAPVFGNPEGGELTLDWGANAAVLFGRQMTRNHHQTSAVYFKTGFIVGHVTTYPPVRSANPVRMKSVIAPNLGGFAGLSYVFPNAKLSLGYRADFFFGAMDGGIDAARKETRGFYGPFASVSVGIGG
jgi:hypothetical protein